MTAERCTFNIYNHGIQLYAALKGLEQHQELTPTQVNILNAVSILVNNEDPGTDQPRPPGEA